MRQIGEGPRFIRVHDAIPFLLADAAILVLAATATLRALTA